MSWSYSGDPASSSMDAVRWWCGDTDTNDQLVQNEEFEYVLSLQPNVQYAAADVCDAIAARLRRQADQSVDGVRESLSQKAKAFADQADKLRSNAGALVEPAFGGITWSEKDALREDTDLVQPSFRVGQGDNPGIPFERAGDDYDPLTGCD